MAEKTLARRPLDEPGCESLLCAASAQIVEIARAVERMQPMADDPNNTVLHALMGRIEQLADTVVEAIDAALEKDLDDIRLTVEGVNHGATKRAEMSK